MSRIPAMTLREMILTIGWTNRDLARRLSLPEPRVRRWASGRYETPAEVLEWLQPMALYHERYPAPPGLTRGS